MNLMLWLLAGGFAGWAGFRFFRANAARGLLMVSVRESRIDAELRDEDC